MYPFVGIGVHVLQGALCHWVHIIIMTLVHSLVGAHCCLLQVLYNAHFLGAWLVWFMYIRVHALRSQHLVHDAVLSLFFNCWFGS